MRHFGHRWVLRRIKYAVCIGLFVTGVATAQPYQPDANGEWVIEAEHFDLNVSLSARDWIPDFTPGYVGDSAMLSAPNSWLAISSNLSATSPRMDYAIESASATTVNIWIRGLGRSGSEDSLWVGLDGNDGSAIRINPTRGDWGWETSSTQLSIPAGVHTLNIWMREDGTIVDRILLRPSGAVPSGDGPPESLRGTGGPGNTWPIAANDALNVAEDSVNAFLDVLSNNGSGADFDPDGDPLTVLSVVSPGSAGGSVSVSPSGDGLRYSPAQDFVGVETFNYTISDGRGGTSVATVSVTVLNANNDAPVLNTVGNRSVTEGQALNFGVSATDVDGSPQPDLLADLSELPGSPGFVDSGDGNGTFSWNAPDGSAPATFEITFTARDAINPALSDSETISIAVMPAGGSGGTGAFLPDAQGQVVMEAENFALNVAQGGREWIADFTAGFVGSSAMLSDPNSWLTVSSNIAANSPRLDYEVNYANGTFVNVWIRGLGPSGSADSVWVGIDGDDSNVLRINPTRRQWGWETATGQLFVPAGLHTLNVWMREDGTIIDRILITPSSQQPGGDGPVESSRDGGSPSNAVPLAFNDAFVVSEDSSGNSLAVLANNGGGADFDPDGDPLTITSADNPSSNGGQVAISGNAMTISYTPQADFSGTDTFGYRISDGRGGTASATVTVTVNNSNNDVPILLPVGNRVVSIGQALAFSVAATDVDAPPAPRLQANLSQLPGSPVFTDNTTGTASFSWTPPIGTAPGNYPVSFTAIDAVNASLTASETISISVQDPGNGGGSGAFQADSNGQVVMEAEHFDANQSRGGRDWIENYSAGYVGDSAMITDPNSWLSVSSGINANSPRLDYEVEYAATTSVNVWIRGLGPSGSADSVWIGIDGNDANVLRINPTRGQWGWETNVGRLTIPAGVHTINVWMREDGTIIDRILLTPQSNVPSGNGPSESPRGGAGGGDALPITDDFSDGNADGWTVTDDNTQFPSAWDVSGNAYRQSARTNSSGGDVTETYHRGSYAVLNSTSGLDDYRFSVSAVPGDESADDIGVMFRYTDSANYYRFAVNSINGFARLESVVNGTYFTLANNLRGYRPGETQDFVIEAEGSLLQVFLNGDALFAALDTDHPAGGVALYARDDVSFDDVAVTENSTAPAVVIAMPVAHSVAPNGPDDVSVQAIARNVPANNGEIVIQYDAGSGAISCGNVAENPTGVFAASCDNLPDGDYTFIASLQDNGLEVDRDTNVDVAIGSAFGNIHQYDAIGNSITRGVGDNFGRDNLGLVDQRTIGTTGWPALLGDFLTQATGAPNLVANEGIPGDRAGETEALRLFSVIERHPESDRALIILGTNDSNDFNTTSVGDLVADIQASIDLLHANGRDLVYLAQLPPAWGPNLGTAFADPLSPGATRNQTIIAYNSAIRGMLGQQGVASGPDLFSCFLTPSVNRFSLFEDSLHPNALGHAMIAALWRDAILNGVVPPVSSCPAPVYILEALDPYSFGHKQNLLEQGDRYYTDEDFTLTAVPAELADGVWVMPRNADRDYASSSYLSFDAGAAPVSVYIAYDPAGTPPTSSTHSFQSVNLSSALSSTDPSVSSFDFVRATGVTGIVNLGGNKSGGGPALQQAYLVIVVQ